MTQPPDKVCVTCGRHFSWRARWAKNWESVKYCSDACRRQKCNATDQALEEAILALLRKRAQTASICPSEAARAVLPAEEALTARGMERTRRAARRLIAAGLVEMTQKGQVVDPDRARGPIRLRQAARRRP